ncbi:MAG TPA: hypothetical protein VMP08_08145, partial [Anaerolineae bacterium]|nr:hypothetical protein [Anaerolineae bacterium]
SLVKPKAISKSRSTRTTIRRQARSCGLPRPGQKCPQCRQGKLDYDGLLNLVCPACGHTAFAGSFT